MHIWLTKPKWANIPPPTFDEPGDDRFWVGLMHNEGVVRDASFTTDGLPDIVTKLPADGVRDALKNEAVHRGRSVRGPARENGPVVQILQILLYNPYPTMNDFVTEMCTCVHISATKSSLVGYLSNALCNLWDGSIDYGYSQFSASRVLICSHNVVTSLLWVSSSPTFFFQNHAHTASLS